MSNTNIDPGFVSLLVLLYAGANPGRGIVVVAPATLDMGDIATHPLVTVVPPGSAYVPLVDGLLVFADGTEDVLITEWGRANVIPAIKPGAIVVKVETC